MRVQYFAKLDRTICSIKQHKKRVNFLYITTMMGIFMTFEFKRA